MAGPSVELLQRIPLFAELESRELGRLSGSFKERTFEPGESVVAEGEHVSRFFVIESGEASVSVRGGERDKLGPGDYFGEIALIDEGARTATVTADTDMKTYAMTFWEFRPIVETDSRIAWKLVQALAHKLREADARQAAS